jgi:hypothetical protein
VRRLREVVDLGGAGDGGERMMDDVTETLPRAVLVDIDGTLALRGDGDGVRRFYDWHRVGEDLPNPAVIELLNMIAPAWPPLVRIILFSGRDEVCREQTEEWLLKHDVPWHELHMRRHKDNRKDSIVKRELYEANVLGSYRVVCVIDDRTQVVRMWRDELGLTCLQVADGDF